MYMCNVCVLSMRFRCGLCVFVVLSDMRVAFVCDMFISYMCVGFGARVCVCEE